MKMMKNLAISCKKGYILAKAVRIASICEPDDVMAYDLEEDFYTDSFIWNLRDAPVRKVLGVDDAERA